MDVYIYIMVGMFASFLLCIGLLLIYFKYRRGLLQQKYKMKEVEIMHQKGLLNAIITSQENERSRIGMDLHDQVGASLSSLILLIDGKDSLLKTRIDNIINSVRNISHDLSPRIKGKYGFIDAIADFCDSVNSSGRITVSLTFTNTEAEISLHGNTAIAIYRVLGEFISNTIKHAHASKIEITFTCLSNEYIIDYKDNGTGLSNHVSKKGMGMQNIESRLGAIGASYQIIPCIEGFQTTIKLPVFQ